MNTLPPQTGTAFFLPQGSRLIVIDPHGQQVSDLFCVNGLDRSEYLSAGRSIDYHDGIYLTTGASLYSNRSNKMLTILEDTCGRHDFLLTPCSFRMFQIVAQNEEWHASCDENLCTNLAAFDIPPQIASVLHSIYL